MPPEEITLVVYEPRICLLDLLDAGHQVASRFVKKGLHSFELGLLYRDAWWAVLRSGVVKRPVPRV